MQASCPREEERRLATFRPSTPVWLVDQWWSFRPPIPVRRVAHLSPTDRRTVVLWHFPGLAAPLEDELFDLYCEATGAMAAAQVEGDAVAMLRGLILAARVALWAQYDLSDHEARQLVAAPWPDVSHEVRLAATTEVVEIVFNRPVQQYADLLNRLEAEEPGAIDRMKNWRQPAPPREG